MILTFAGQSLSDCLICGGDSWIRFSLRAGGDGKVRTGELYVERVDSVEIVCKKKTEFFHTQL